MVRLRVRLYGGIGEIGRKTDLEIDLQEKKPTVLSVLQKLAQKFGSKFLDYFFDETGNYSGAVLVVVNGRDIKHLGGLKTIVSSGDTVVIVPPASGGHPRCKRN